MQEQIKTTTIAGRTFVERVRGKRSTYWIDGERVGIERFFAAQSVSEGKAAWLAYAAQQGGAA